MSHYAYRAVVTPKTAEWLRALSRDPKAQGPARGQTAYRCRVLDWTDYLVELRDGTHARFDELPLPKPNCKFIGEVLTDKGRAALEAYEAELKARAQ